MFPFYILRREQGIVKSNAIQRRITNRLKDWKNGLMSELVQCVVVTARRGTGGKRTADNKSIARTFHSMVAQGKLCSAVCVATFCDGGGVYLPEDTDTKSGRRVIDVLQDKHPDMIDPDINAEGWMSFGEYEEGPGMLAVNCDQEIVKTIAGKLSGGAGPNSVDGRTLKDWLIHHGKALQTLRKVMALWVELPCNTMVPWARIRRLMENRLCTLDNQPGVRPLGIG